MIKLHEIYINFYDIDPNDYTGIIQFYERNSLFLDNKSAFQDKDDFNDHVIVLGQYVISLENIGKYSKSIIYAEKALHLIDSKADEYCINLNNFTPYWSILTSKGSALYNLKDYKNSIQVFDKLLLWDANNDNFKNWRDAAKSKKRNSISNYLFTIAGLFLVTEIFLGDIIGIPKVKLYMSGIGLLLILIALFNDYFLGKVIKWFRNY